MGRASFRTILFYIAAGAVLLFSLDALVSLYISCDYPEYGPPCHYDEQEYRGTGNALLLNFLYFALFDASANQVIAAFTVILTLATVGLFWIGKQQIELTKILQRPYVAVEIANIRPVPDIGKFIPRINIRNAGRMPAKNVGWVFGKPRFSCHRVWKPTRDPDAPNGNVTMPPGMQMTHGGEMIWFPSAEFIGKRKFLYIWGYVRYDNDMTGSHTTKFCHRYNLETQMDERRNTRRSLFLKLGRRYNRYYNDAT